MPLFFQVGFKLTSLYSFRTCARAYNDRYFRILQCEEMSPPEKDLGGSAFGTMEMAHGTATNWGEPWCTGIEMYGILKQLPSPRLPRTSGMI
jgi:hypothetical protein